MVGPVDRDEVYDAADRAAKQLDREVNPTVVSESRWRDRQDADPFIRRVTARPLVHLFPGPRAGPDPAEQ